MNNSNVLIPLPSRNWKKKKKKKKITSDMCDRHRTNKMDYYKMNDELMRVRK